MALVYAFLADGLEEVECLTVADILIRAGIRVKLISIGDRKEVRGAHGFRIRTDDLLKNVDCSRADVLFLPGGQPGTDNLFSCRPLTEALQKASESGRRIAAICAAPSVLGRLGILEGKKATCYPGYEDKLIGAKLTGAGVVTDGNITTARGLGYAIELGLELVRILQDSPTSQHIRESIQYAN